MAALWEYSGLVSIERLNGNIGEPMQLPVCFHSPASEPLLSADEIEEQAKQLAVAFLEMLEGSDPKHRGDYGDIQSINIGSIVQKED